MEHYYYLEPVRYENVNDIDLSYRGKKFESIVDIEKYLFLIPRNRKEKIIRAWFGTFEICESKPRPFPKSLTEDEIWGDL